MTERKANYLLPRGANRREAALVVTKPHLSIVASHLGQSCPTFLEHLQAFLANPDDDPTGLRLFNLLTEAQFLQQSAEQVVNLLNQIDASRAKPAAPERVEEPGEEHTGEWWENS